MKCSAVQCISVEQPCRMIRHASDACIVSCWTSAAPRRIYQRFAQAAAASVMAERCANSLGQEHHENDAEKAWKSTTLRSEMEPGTSKMMVRRLIFAALGGSWVPCERPGDPEADIFAHSGSLGRAFRLIWEALVRHLRPFRESWVSLLESR